MKTPRIGLLNLLALSFLMGCFALPARAQQQLIEAIEVHGNRRIPADTIRARIFTRPGDVYDEAALERDFSSLWNTGYFEDLRFEREPGAKGGWIIHVYVKEKPTIRTIDYKGLSSVSVSDVLDRYKQDKVGLTVESQYDPTKIKKAEVVLKALLAEHGHQFATVTTELRQIPPAAVGVTFNIKEGPKVKVGKIDFEGNKKLSDRQLRNSMRFSKPIGIPHSFILENLFARTYDATKLEHDLELVRDAYQRKGYFKALVGEPTTKMRDTGRNFINPFSRAGKRVDITIPIEEGDRYRLGEITFTGNKAVPNTKALRSIFQIKDGDVLDVDKIRKGVENLRKAYGELGYINFTVVPNTHLDEDKKTVSFEMDIDEGKAYSVRRIEFTGNTTTRDKVIRRELALEEGQLYNSRLWELSLLRLNQLQYFEPLKVEEDSEIKRNDQEATVDINLKVKEKGKNSIGLTGGVSGLAGSFIGLNYQTNNFLGLGETLTVEANVGSRERNLLFGFTEPYLFDRPIQFGFTVYTRRFDYNQARETELLLNQQLNLSQDVLNSLQNFSQSSTGFSVSTSYALHHSFKRVGLAYAFDRSSVHTFSDASQALFQQIAFRSVSGQNALLGIVTSKILPSFSFNTIDSPVHPHSGKSLFLGGDISGIGGNVAYIRPVIEWKQWIPMRGTQALGYRVQGSWVTGYRGLVTPPQERLYSGGENDIRGFDIRTVSPYVFLVNKVDLTLSNPDGTPVPIDPTNPRRGAVKVPVPVMQLAQPGGDTNIIGNLEYRIPIVGPVTLAGFVDGGLDFITRPSQLRLSEDQFNELNSTLYGCQSLDISFTCVGGQNITFNRNLSPVPGTNYVPRVSTGVEVQVLLPIINAPFRIYYAYNPLILDKTISTPFLITRDMFPAGGAGDFTFQQAQQSFNAGFRLREPRKTFRFTVATTF